MTRHWLTASAAVMFTATMPTFGSSMVPACGADASSQPASTPYVAVRHLEARTEKSGRQGWMDVRTTLTADRRFIYEVLQEGGSNQIREKALIAALKREQELVARGAAVYMPALLTSYACDEAQPDPDGLLRMAIRPREPSKHLVNGVLLLDPHSGSVLRLSGALSKSPSFWVSDVEMDWSYAMVAGVVLPAAVQARARVKLVGPSTFSMTYRYVSVGGRLVGDGAVTDSSTIDRRQ
jgi:hypothetical protein